jgi:hypothetical protein
MHGVLTYPPPPPAGDDAEEKPPDSYAGPLRGGVRAGSGTYSWSSGTVYKGPYKEGRKHGEGVLTFADGGKYEGAAPCNSAAAARGDLVHACA